MMFVPHRKCLSACKSWYEDCFTLLFVDNIRASQEAHVRASTASYGDSFTFLYVDNVRKVAGSRPDEVNDFYKFT
jgi:hypothetical protein